TVIIQAGDHDVGPEARPVLPEAPPFLLKPPFGRGHLQLMRRLLKILRRIKDRKMFSEDLFRPIALDPLRPGVPAHDMALRIEHKNGVVPRSFHEEAIPLLTSG